MSIMKDRQEESNGVGMGEFRDVDNLAVICIGLMAMCSAEWVQVFNLGMIALYIWAHRADLAGD
jgi:hypothetical protein